MLERESHFLAGLVIEEVKGNGESNVDIDACSR